ncbi:MAG: hypothetical protein HKM94_02875 [Halobacteria archaeon]|nr:hypothetical protein [Halobacteria archaeon]
MHPPALTRAYAGGLSAGAPREIQKMMQMHHFLPQFVTIIFLDDSTRGKKGLLHLDMSAEFQNAGEKE